MAPLQLVEYLLRVGLAFGWLGSGACIQKVSAKHPHATMVRQSLSRARGTVFSGPGLDWQARSIHGLCLGNRNHGLGYTYLGTWIVRVGVWKVRTVHQARRPNQPGFLVLGPLILGRVVHAPQADVLWAFEHRQGCESRWQPQLLSGNVGFWCSVTHFDGILSLGWLLRLLGRLLAKHWVAVNESKLNYHEKYKEPLCLLFAMGHYWGNVCYFTFNVQKITMK